MDGAPSSMTPLPETVGTLRSLIRESEARGSRLRLLLETARDLGTVEGEALDGTLAVAAQRLALFLGYRSGVVVREDGAAEAGLAVRSPGPAGRLVARLILDGHGGGPDEEDAGVRDVLLQQIGAAIDRVERETERAALLTLLVDREARLERVVDRLFTSQEDERRRVSQDLHDGVAQRAGALLRQIEACGHDLDPMDQDRLEPAIDSARGLIAELRAIIAGLRPTALDDLGLAAAIGALADGLGEAGFAVTLDTVGPDRASPVVETGLYRVAQEALNNVAKHARPGRVAVQLERSGQTLTLRVRDEGPGFDPALATATPGRPGHQIGLQVMGERMAALGGTLGIQTAPGSGTVVTAIVPVGVQP